MLSIHSFVFAEISRSQIFLLLLSVNKNRTWFTKSSSSFGEEELLVPLFSFSSLSFPSGFHFRDLPLTNFPADREKNELPQTMDAEIVGAASASRKNRPTFGEKLNLSFGYRCSNNVHFFNCMYSCLCMLLISVGLE